MALVDIEKPTAVRHQRLLGQFRYWHCKLQGRIMLSEDGERANMILAGLYLDRAGS